MKISETRLFELGNNRFGHVKSEMRNKIESLENGQGFEISESDDIQGDKKKAIATSSNLSTSGKRFSIRWSNPEKTAFTVIRTK